ncbi:MAG: ABC transporter ATP-binding protein [Candidatus Syntrophonatronum acetioxidans]|uniref:ABC transporter ATP-binding protein n=1 Tax=Candidatus Syntrophonatronum acetioxidans TaxID=1795816 RepID=A0A424YIC8_9FIRM|nr:MAG: ABC transporter ATP-binding protein [Candidatus Syntrophonatronum acetioxidans]
MKKPLLEAKNLTVSFKREEGFYKAVDKISFNIGSREVVGLVGESGSGKTAASLSLLKLLSFRGVVEGEVLFDGVNLFTLPERDLKKIRGREIGVIFQEPMTSLNPVLNIGVQIMEPMVEHENISWTRAREKALSLLNEVGIKDSARRMKEFPHQLSGGIRQRVMISMALACSPRLLIADEPTTALDVTIQSQIIELLKKIRKKTPMAVLLVSHDLGVVRELCERVMIMYGGRILETGNIEEIFKAPLHPYTRSLVQVSPFFEGKTRERASAIDSVPYQSHLSPGCKFQPRCSWGNEKCREVEPPLKDIKNKGWLDSGMAFNRQVRCWKYLDERGSYNGRSPAIGK